MVRSVGPKGTVRASLGSWLRLAAGARLVCHAAPVAVGKGSEDVVRRVLWVLLAFVLMLAGSGGTTTSVMKHPG